LEEYRSEKQEDRTEAHELGYMLAAKLGCRIHPTDTHCHVRKGNKLKEKDPNCSLISIVD
jgi:hypothetical protein